MPAKRPAPTDPEKLVDNIHHAIRAYIEAGYRKVLAIGPSEPRIGRQCLARIRRTTSLSISTPKTKASC